MGLFLFKYLPKAEIKKCKYGNKIGVSYQPLDNGIHCQISAYFPVVDGGKFAYVPTDSI